ncbi:hypothetical protein SprV_0200842000 [Sparganum proliferum]
MADSKAADAELEEEEEDGSGGSGGRSLLVDDVGGEGEGNGETTVPQGRTIWPEKVDEHRIRMHETLSGLLAPHIQHVVEFAKRIPEFGHLGQPDQLVLIKASFFEVWMTQAAKTFSPSGRTVIIGDGRQIAKQELDFIYSVRPNLLNV